jgi:O-antigen ligase
MDVAASPLSFVGKLMGEVRNCWYRIFVAMEILIVIAALVGLVWGAVIFLRGGLFAGALIVLFAGTCIGYPPIRLSVGIFPLTSDRILWSVLMLQLLFFWRMGLTESRRVGRTEAILLAFIGVLAATVVMNDWTVNRGQSASRFVFYYLMPMGMYWVGWQARLTERGLTTMYVVLGLFGAYLAFTAIAEMMEWTALVFPPYIMSADYQVFLGRARGPTLNPAANGILLGLCMGGGLMMWPRVGRRGKLLLIAFSGLLSLGVFCTLTRSAWMGGASGLLLLVLLALPRRYRPLFLAAATVVAAAIVVTQWANIVEFKRDRNLSARETATSAQLRPILAATAWEMFCDRPLLGCGLGHYTDQHVNYLANRDVDLPLEQGRPYAQHNIWLSLLTETGLVGAGLFLLLTIAWLRSAWRLWRADRAPLWMRQEGLLFLVLAANYLMNGMFQDMTICTMIHMILFLMAGLTVNLQARAANWENRTGAAVESGEPR